MKRTDRCSYIAVAYRPIVFGVKFYARRPNIDLEFIYLFVVYLSDVRRPS